jgi:phosphatidylserine/phosphatidylglycerophosphate/cardiolipin synthase-like enzyme
MRKREKQNGLEVTAIVGTSAVLLSFDMEQSAANGLLGFAIEREDHTEDEKYYLKGFKYFEETAGNTGEGQLFSTYEHPVQSFMWEDFSVKTKHDYSYTITPVYGKPKKLEYGKSCTIRFITPAEDAGEHSVYFNRGVAGSLAYARKFKNKRPGSDEMTEAETEEALVWLSRGLKEALIGFIDKAKDTTYQLRAAVYEFEYLPVLEAFKTAYEDRQVDVKIIYDSRGEEEANNEAINEAGLPRTILIARKAEAEKKYIAHNKFIVLIKDNVPVEVWTGSTNITQKGIFGQCNVGHIIRNKDIARQYLDYWEYLEKDPLNTILDKQTIKIQPDLKFDDFPQGTTAFFSPRDKKTILQTYADYMKNSHQLVCGMFPFSFSKKMKEVIIADTDNLKYIIIDKKDKNTTLTTNDYDNIIVYGTYLKDGLYDWLEETHAGFLLNAKPGAVGTNFIHNKVLLIDPLGEDPIVISGSANFSDNSISGNDENTLVIRGNKDVADLYFTEFVRIFNHYYARYTALKMSTGNNQQENPIHLKTDYTKWVPAFYNKNGLKYKRKKMFVDMVVK